MKKTDILIFIVAMFISQNICGMKLYTSKNQTMSYEIMPDEYKIPVPQNMFRFGAYIDDSDVCVHLKLADAQKIPLFAEKINDKKAKYISAIAADYEHLNNIV